VTVAAKINTICTLYPDGDTMTSVKRHRVQLDQPVTNIKGEPIIIGGKAATIGHVLVEACEGYTAMADTPERAHKKNVLTFILGEKIYRGTNDGDGYVDLDKDELEHMKTVAQGAPLFIGVAKVRMMQALDGAEEIDYTAKDSATK
jgi:hypothetical protein